MGQNRGARKSRGKTGGPRSEEVQMLRWRRQHGGQAAQGGDGAGEWGGSRGDLGGWRGKRPGRHDQSGSGEERMDGKGGRERCGLGWYPGEKGEGTGWGWRGQGERAGKGGGSRGEGRQTPAGTGTGRQQQRRRRMAALMSHSGSHSPGEGPLIMPPSSQAGGGQES